MRFHATSIDGAWLLELERHEDVRGYFARSWSKAELAERGLNTEVSECSISFNKERGTLRGMHYQIAPHEETKIVTCIRGRIFDAIVDLRPDSSTYLESFGSELSLENGRLLYVPPGVAHGFVTLEPDSYLHYQIGGVYVPADQRGVRWNDPLLSINWPLKPVVISERDAAFEDFVS